MLWIQVRKLCGNSRIIRRNRKIVVIDHHRRSTEYIEDATLMFHEVYASSAAELVTEILEYSQEKLS